jgi:hypothetical protein
LTVAFEEPEAVAGLRGRRLTAGEVVSVEPVSVRDPWGRRFHLAKVVVHGDEPLEPVLGSLRKAPGVLAAVPAKKNIMCLAVQFRARAVSRDEAERELREVGLLTLRPTFGSRNLFEVILVTDEPQDGALRKVRALKGVATADPNFTYEVRQ